MSRLIDEDKLLQDISNTINDWIKEIPDGEYLKGNVTFAEMAKEIVRNQPTAFDVEKVVEQLEHLEPFHADGYGDVMVNCDDVIEIVKRS